MIDTCFDIFNTVRIFQRKCFNKKKNVYLSSSMLTSLIEFIKL